MHILLLEDRGMTAFTVKQLLEEKHGHIVYTAFNPADADRYISGEEGVDIDAIILDLNLPTNGLDKNTEVPQTQDDLFAGWIWFRDHVLRQPLGEKKDWRNSTVIYSAYLDDLKLHLEAKKLNEDLRLLQQMKQVAKGKIPTPL